MSFEQNSPLTCAHCGERIGVYEPVRVEQDDGTVGSSSYLNLTCADRQAQRRLWHLSCFSDAPAESDG